MDVYQAGMLGYQFQHTAARRRLASYSSENRQCTTGFNTQPPEGGWRGADAMSLPKTMFQHTAARRRLESLIKFVTKHKQVSTHSRPKAAGPFAIT